MADLGSHRCHNCNMVFRTFPLLEKHREKFCIGSQIGDPTVLSSRYSGMGAHTRLSGGREFPRWAETPDFQTRDSVARLRAREKLLNEREQRLIGDYEGQPGNLTDSKALRNLTEEFHKLRKSLEVSAPTLQSFQFQGELGLSSHWDREYRERVLEMTEAHERHLADIQARNQALEMQREEIRQRLSDVASSGSSTSHIEQMLLELKAQEEKNQLALDALRDQVVLIQSESRAKTEKVKERPSSSSVKKEKAPLTIIPFPLRGSSLSSEISALQLAYVQSGGMDPAVLAQMRDLQAEALAFEEISHKQERKEKKKKRHEGVPRTLDVELMAVELENQRLEEEIFSFKMHRSRKKIENGDSELAELQREHLQQMSQLQADVEMLRRDVTRMPPRGGHGPPPFQPPPFAPPLPPPVHPSEQPLGRPEPTIAMGSLNTMRPPSPTANRHILEPLDALGPAPYDPVAGFVIFYDFILGLEPTFQKVRLVSGLYSNGHRMGQPSTLPDTLCEVWNSSQHLANNPRGNIAMLRAKQPIPRVRPSYSISLIMELQASGGFNPYGQEVQHMSSSGWTKLDLFDQHNQVLSGRWKLPVRALPLRPGLSTGQLNTVPQVGKAELHLRVINARDADLQSMAEIDPRNASLYHYPPLMPGPAAAATENPAPLPAHQQPPSSFHLALSPYTDYVDPPPVQELPNQPKPTQRDNGAEEKGKRKEPGAVNTVGFIIDRVTEAPPGDGTLRLTGYHMDTGQVIRTQGKGMSCIISAVSSTIQNGCFIFGEQEAIFDKVAPEDDMLLMLRFYHWPGGSTAWAPWQYRKSLQPLLASDEWAVAWTVLRLTRPQSPDTESNNTTSHHVEWKTGFHDLPLYHSPAPPVLELSSIRPDSYREMFEPYGGARLRLYMFSMTRPDFPFPAEVPITDSDGCSTLPEGVYIPHSQRNPPAESYQSKDTITLFIDGARFLPDAVTVTRVTGRIFDRNYDQIGPDICTGIDLNSDIFQPSYNYSVEIKSPNVPPTATLLLKIYTIDRFTRDLALIGWAAINLFLESGTHIAPKSDSGDIQVSLNEGAHQIRVYYCPPPTDQAFSVESLTSSGRIVPCATLLLRITKGGTPTPIRSHPEYSHGVYSSNTANPTSGETQLYRAMVNRSMVQVREVIPRLAGSSAQGLLTDKLLSDWVNKTFTERMKESPQPFNLSCVSPYLVTSGMKISLDAAPNLPWSGFTFAHICFNPPAAFYYGHPWMRYDRAITVHDIDMSSDQRCPAWRDGFKTFTHRVFHKYLTIIIHLHEIVTQEPEGNMPDSEQTQPGSTSQGTTPVLRPASQAWTVLGVFYKSYCNLGVYQLPLYQGAPNQTVLRALQSGNCREKLQELEREKMIVKLAAASVIVRIADERRQEEVATYNPQDVNLTYLPEDAIDSYTAQPSGRKIVELVPGTQDPDTFKALLVNWFRKYLTSTDQKHPQPTPREDVQPW